MHWPNIFSEHKELLFPSSSFIWKALFAFHRLFVKYILQKDGASMGNFFREQRKLFASLSTTKRYRYDRIEWNENAPGFRDVAPQPQ